MPDAGSAAAGPGSLVSARTGAVGAETPTWLEAGLRRSVRLEARLRPRSGARVGRRGAAGPAAAVPVSGAARAARPGRPAAGDGVASIAEMAGLGAVGAVLGLAAGGTVGGRVGCSHDFCTVDGRIVGAWLGGSVGLSTGVHVANGLRGSWIGSTAVSLGINGLTTLLAVDIRDSETTAVLIPLGAAGSLVASVLIEKGSSDADNGPE